MFAWVKNVPGIWSSEIPISDDLLKTYFFYKFLSFIFVNLGISYYEKRYHRPYVYRETRISSDKSFFKIGLLLLIIGTIIKYNIISSAGGLSYILSHIQSRKALLAGMHYDQVISSALLTCAVLFCQFYYVKTKTKGALFLFSFSFVVALLLSMVFGARKPALMLVIQVMMFNHFINNRYTVKSLLSIRSLGIVMSIMMFMVMMPMLRESAETDLAMNPLAWANEALESINSVLNEFSYHSGDLFVFEYFSDNELWHGQTYMNIIIQWIPSNLYPKKPPMDDGMYLWNMMNGYFVTPTTPTKDLILDSSIPFTMEGALFSNFGVVGIIVGAFFIGIFYQKVYRILNDTNCPIIMLIIYQQVMFSFVPSVLHTTSVILSCGLLGFIIYFITGFKFSRMR